MLTTLAPDQLFIVFIMTINTLVWAVLRIPKNRQKLPSIYLIVRSWWWMLALLFGCYWLSNRLLDMLFIFIGLRGGYEIIRLRRVSGKLKLLAKLAQKQQLASKIHLNSSNINSSNINNTHIAKAQTQADSVSVQNNSPIAPPTIKFGVYDIVLLLVLMVLIASLIWLNHLTLMRGQHAIILFVLFASQFNDIAQYLCGRGLGGKLFTRKLAPKLSPNKTIEGALFGSVLSASLATLLGLWLTPFNTVVCFGFAYLLAVSGIAGDLLESAFKRHHGIKDTGTMLAGHGGVLDRIDSLLLGVPLFTVIYWYFYPVASSLPS